MALDASHGFPVCSGGIRENWHPARNMWLMSVSHGEDTQVERWLCYCGADITMLSPRRAIPASLWSAHPEAVAAVAAESDGEGHRYTHTITPAAADPPAAAFAQPCEAHRWVVGEDACVICGQSWREIYKLVGMTINSDGSFAADVVRR